MFADDWDVNQARIVDIHDGTIEEKADGSSFLELRVNEYILNGAGLCENEREYVWVSLNSVRK